ncbi:MAG: carboxypeptidase-like regulatory domain-containing protein [Saprospiraceae bacterium]
MLKLKRRKLNYFLFSIIFLFGMQSGMAQNPTDILQKEITFEANNESVIELLEKIEKQTDLTFVYSPNDLDNSIRLNFFKKKIKTGDLLIKIFEKTPISFKANGEQIILFKTNVRKIGLRKNNVIKPSKNIVFSGYVLDAKTGEAMITAAIYEKKTFTATTTNNFGFFSLTLPNGSHTIVISFVGYQTQEINLSETQQMQIKLLPASNEITQVVVSASKEKEKENNPIESSRMGLMRIPAQKLKAIPAVAGEPDILKAITLLPGISQSVEGSAGFYVRGGGSDQNLILMDGVPMYNPHHLFGFLSTFNPDAINNIEITKGAFPARYGGRLSSVLDITLNDGNNQEWKKNISFGLLSARASVSGPLKKETSSIFFSARRTILDLIIAPIAADRDGKKFVEKPSYNFGDVNLKFNYKLSEKDRIYVSGFFSRDNLSLKINAKDEFVGTQKLREATGWSSAFGSVRWNHLFSDKLFLNTTAYYSNYNYFAKRSKEVEGSTNGILPNSENRSDYFSIINDLTFKQDYQYYLNNNHHIRFGGGVIFHEFKPGVNSFSKKIDGATILSSTPDNTTKATEFSLYAEDDIRVNDKLKLNIGVHASALDVQDTSYFSVQPRLSARYLVSKKIALKIGFSQMTQYLHLLTSSNLTKSSDLWVPVTKNILPPTSTQYSIGTAFSFGKNYEVEIEGYYKDMKNIIDYKEGASFLLTTGDWENKVERGSGESYGAEFFIQKKKGRWTGWLGYTLSWTNRTFENINFGKSYPYKYDRRHDISIVGSYQINKTWSMNASWIFNSGNYVSLSTASHVTANYDGDVSYGWFEFPAVGILSFDISAINPGLNSNPPARNNYKLPDYHRLDISTSRKKITKRGNRSEWIFGLTNAYNKFNPSIFSQSFSVEDDGNNLKLKSKITQYALFPILPTVSYSLSF